MPADSIALNLAATVLEVSVLLALGARLRRLFRLPCGGSLSWGVDLTIGAWAAATTVLGAALAGLTQLPVLLLLAGIWAAAGRWRGSRRPWLPVVAGVAGGLLFLPVALGPPFFYDAMVYHLGLPWQVVVEGRLNAHPENLFSTFPPLAQLLAVPPLAGGLLRVPAMLHWCAWVAAAAAVHGLARRNGAPRWAALLAAAVSLVVPAAPLVPGFPAAEAWSLVGLIPAVALATGARSRQATALAGWCAGVATAARLQALPWSALVLTVIAVRRRGAVRPIAICAGGWLLGSLPWWLKNLLLLRDPIAPLLWNREGMDVLWRDSVSRLQAGSTMLDVLVSLPRLLAPEATWMLPLLLAAVLSLAGRRRRLSLAVAVAFGIASWVTTGTLPRFLVPTACLLLALTAAADRGRLRWIAAGAALLWCGIVGIGRGTAWLQRIDIAHLVSLDVRAAAGRLAPNDPLAAFAAAHELPIGARVLFVSEPRTFLFPRPCIAPSQVDLSPLQPHVESAASMEEIVDELRQERFTHLLVNWGELERLASSYPVAPWRTPTGRRRFGELIRHLEPPVIDRSGVQVFELSP